jgi:AraC family transcriptional regulator of adaptative response / DNA-3-methyladenine glycosylase II
LAARDARFDGLFFVGITSTRVYCRPTCPARVSYHDRRRFFDSAAAAEHAGFRPCLRCRPELAPGRAPMDAIPRLARVAADRIGAGALNGHSVAHLAEELGVSERHLRRALEQEIGVSPTELAQTHRLLFAKRLLADTSLPVTRIAFASGFQSLRRFNSVFRERYRLSPRDLRRGGLERGARRTAPRGELVSLTLAYRPPLAWNAQLALMGRGLLPGVELIQGGRYLRTVSLDGHAGVIVAEDHARVNGRDRIQRPQLEVQVDAGLLPVLMPLLARLRRLFDLDADPGIIDSQLAQGGLGPLVRRRPGLRIPGAYDGFEAALTTLLLDAESGGPHAAGTAAHIVAAFGEPFDSGIPGLTRLAPSAARLAEAGAVPLAALGVPAAAAGAITAIALACTQGLLPMLPGSNPTAARLALMNASGIEQRLATTIIMRGLHWPDAFPAEDPALQRAMGTKTERALRAVAESWRPWRAYAALHLSLHNQE